MRVPDINVKCNVLVRCLRDDKVVRGSERQGHNVLTTVGRDWLAHLMAWRTIGGTDEAFTNRRVRWMGVGTGSQLEVPGVLALDTPVLVTDTDYLVPIQSVSFPTPTIAEFYRRFAPAEISLTGNPVVQVSEVGLFVDVAPVGSLGGFDDDPFDVGEVTTLNPAVGTNTPIAYKALEPISKTQDVALEMFWQLRVL